MFLPPLPSGPDGGAAGGGFFFSLLPTRLPPVGTAYAVSFFGPQPFPGGPEEPRAGNMHAPAPSPKGRSALPVSAAPRRGGAAGTPEEKLPTGRGVLLAAFACPGCALRPTWPTGRASPPGKRLWAWAVFPPSGEERWEIKGPCSRPLSCGGYIFFSILWRIAGPLPFPSRERPGASPGQPSRR